ncbi:MAG TPA: serine/threonine-protein kinase, partial [Polyangiaceae bacterium]|nr:serine/threonine-protein kinase [Polyangiaceae bacterium]
MVVTNQQAVARPRIVGRYALFDEIAAGGMATIHLGRLVGPVGFSRTVAIKTLHPQFAKDPEFVEMFLEEARLASRIQHPNVISTLDVATGEGEVFLVMEYVAGESLAKLVRSALKKGELMPVDIATSVLAGMLHGLHATHEAKNEQLEAMHIVHRDVSPQNVLVGLDGVARIFDFGVAKAAAMRSQVTSDGQMKGKLSYMSPEQLNSREVDRRTDVFAAGVVAWECLTGKRLFAGSDPGEVLAKVLTLDITPPIEVQGSIPRPLSDTVMRALERSPEQRWQTARDFAIELERSTPLAAPHVVGDWVELNASDAVQDRRHRVESVERASVDLGHSSIPAQGGAAQAIAAHALATSVLAISAPPAPLPVAVEAQPASGPRDVGLALEGPEVANANSGTSRSSNLTVSSSAAANDPGPTRRRAVLLGLSGCAAAVLAVALWHWQDGGFEESDALPSPAASLPEPPSDVRTVPTREPAP